MGMIHTLGRHVVIPPIMGIRVFAPRTAAAAPAGGLLSGLLAYWSLEENGGNRSDATANGYTMLESASSIASASGKISDGANIGAAGGKFLYNTSDDFRLSPTRSGTWCCWVNMTISGDCYPMGRWQAAGDWFLTATTDGSCGACVRSSTDQSALAPASTLNNLGGIWYWLCGWYDHTVGTHGTVYFQCNDGTVYSTALTSAKADTASMRTYIGAVVEGYGYIQGVIDEVGFWDRVLEADERAALYNSGSGLAFSSFT